MTIDLGIGCIAITIIVSVFGIVAAILAATLKNEKWQESTQNALILTWVLLSISVVSLLILLVTNHFEVAYVYEVTDTSMPVYLRITALWGGQSGSLLFWCWLIAGAGAIYTLRSKSIDDHKLFPWASVVIFITLFFFVSLVMFLENPFARYWILTNGSQVLSVFAPQEGILIAPPDGRGLNPLLRHFGMVIHPPTLYIGFVLFIIPFAIAISALINGTTKDTWIKNSRRWVLTAWIFLSIGLVLGSRWAYDVLGWGGYWGWDPIEIAALLPWLSGTAYIHSIMIEERLGLFKRWNVILILMTFSLVIFGTFLTRSGLVSSVHAFSASPIGVFFLGFVAFMFLGSVVLLLIRWKSLQSKSPMTSLLSRESIFLLNNVIFMGIIFICLWGILFPFISDCWNGQTITVGPPFYKKAAGPLFLVLFVLMGIAPLTAWGRTTIISLGKNTWKPAVFSVVVITAAITLGVREFSALVALFIATFAASITIYDYSRSIYIRSRNSKEGLFAAFLKLNQKNQRRYGGYIIHLGIVMMGIGIIGAEFLQTSTQETIAAGDTMVLDGYSFTYTGLNQYDLFDGRNVVQAFLTVSRNGTNFGEIVPRRDYYYDAHQYVTIPAVRRTLAGDIYVILMDWQSGVTPTATIKIYHTPLIDWLWIGAVILMIGAVIAVWPHEINNKEQPI
jgi:cytochrome c-type biogenesis protein CcmF